jgi:transmembrane protein TMEM220
MAWRIANGFMLALFLFSVVVQYNDPDPARWMAIYGAAALVCVAAFTRRLKWLLPALVGLAAAAWAIWWLPLWWGKTSVSDTFGHMEMVDIPAEEARETLGLFIVVFWMAVVTLRAIRLRRSAS